MARPRERKSEYRAEKSEFDQRVLEVRRTARVIAGGRRFSFRAAVVVGNRNGKVGVGVGKGGEVAVAVSKATRHAKKQLVVVPLGEHKTIPYLVEAKFSAARVLLKPSGEGSGLTAGGPVRVVADLAGIQNLTAKILGSTTNKLNNARATIEALKKLK